MAVAAGETVDPDQAALLGLARTLRAEYPATSVHILDLPSDNAVALAFDSPTAQSSPIAASVANQITDWLRSLLAGKFAGQSTETALRNGSLFQPRIEPGLSHVRQSDDSTWIIQHPGRLETLRPEPSSTPDPTAHEVQIAPLAHGLNFRDVLTALGTYAGASAPLGAECAGVVIKVGSHAANRTDVAPGTMVMALAPGSLRTVVNVSAAYVVAKPPAMSLVQAATIPVAFLTAHYAFSRLVALQPGQTVLIHSAAGGLGQAAVQLAHAASAIVIATAGSPAKRAYLQAQGVMHVFDSRRVDFSEEVLRVTQGRGVDIVLNSLSGDRIAAGFRALTPGGAFLEVGKLGIWTAEQARAVRPDALYWAFDLGEVASQNPSLIAEMFYELMPAFAAGKLAPLPLEVFPITDAVGAFRTMAGGQHIGKLVLTQPPRPLALVRWVSSLAARPGSALHRSAQPRRNIGGCTATPGRRPIRRPRGTYLL
jgi:NADPH:quinone reductase-like Zn-dependent oxidoreductase